jgi:hypothetical protein
MQFEDASFHEVLWKLRFSFEEIGNGNRHACMSCEPTKASFGRYGGIGVRYGTDSSWAYITSFGNAVKIIPTKGKPFVFSSKSVEKVCGIINQVKNKL